MTERRSIEDRLRAACEAGADGELPHLISAEAARLVGLDLSAAPLVEALLGLERPDLLSLAAKLHSRAAQEQAQEARQRLIAERSPVFADGDAAVAMPVGDAGEEAQERITDRLLALLLRSGLRRARLVLDFADGAARDPAAWSALLGDLEEQGIPCEASLVRT